MGKNKQLWVSPDGSDWRVHRPGAARAIQKAEMQQEAFEIARQVARNQGGEVYSAGT